MADLEKKTFNFDNLFKMINDYEKPSTSCNVSNKKKQPLQPKPTQPMLIYNNSLADGECIIDERLLSVHGWLTPTGELFSCKWQQHTKTVNALGFDTERDAIMAGYIKLSNMKWQLGRQYRLIVITDAQRETIDLWHKNNQISQEYFFNDLVKKGKEK